MVTQISFAKIQALSGERIAVPNEPPKEKVGEPVVAAPSPPAANSEDSKNSSTLGVDLVALEQAVSSIAKNAQNKQRALQFSIDEVSGRTIVTVIDKQTDEVIRRIPSEEVQALAEHFGHGRGALVEAKA
jgi:flagellar protein FlaG